LFQILAAQNPVKTKPNRRVSISTIIILVLAAVAGIAYYLGTPPSLPSANSASACPTMPMEIVIPDGIGVNSSIKYEPPTLTLTVGLNNTVVWNDQDTTVLHKVISVSVPPGGTMWDFENMSGGNSYCVTLSAPGTYTYEIYLNYIEEGTIIVKAAP
jgi:plastocyanin